MAAEEVVSSRCVIVSGAGGLRFNADLGSHQVITDQPERGGGAHTAPSPLDLLPVALGSCIALYAHQFCVARDIPDDDLRVEVRWQTAKAPRRISRFEVKVSLPENLPDSHRAALERAVLTCPVHNTFSHAAQIDVELLAPASV
jgi:putative redox protein